MGELDTGSRTSLFPRLKTSLRKPAWPQRSRELGERRGGLLGPPAGPGHAQGHAGLHGPSAGDTEEAQSTGCGEGPLPRGLVFSASSRIQRGSPHTAPLRANPETVTDIVVIARG